MVSTLNIPRGVESLCLQLIFRFQCHPFLNYLTLLIYASSTSSVCKFPPLFTAGEKLVNFMVEPKKGVKWPKELPRFKSRPDAIAVCKELCAKQFMHRSDKVAKGELEVREFFCRKLTPQHVWAKIMVTRRCNLL